MLLLQLGFCIDDLVQVFVCPARNKTRTTTATMPTEGWYLTPGCRTRLHLLKILGLDSWPPETHNAATKPRNDNER